jgi:hypothetical protein
VDGYRTDGYFTRDTLLRPDRFEALKAHFERKLAALPEGERPEHMDVPHFTDPELFRWLLDPDVLDLVESVIGPDITTNLSSETRNGTWRLKAQDVAGADTGTIDTWTLTL